MRCGRCWFRAATHQTEFSTGCGCIVLCESCWSALTPKQRLPYYRKLFGDAKEWEFIELAVMTDEPQFPRVAWWFKPPSLDNIT